MNSVHPECQIHLEIQEEETKCAELLTAQTEQHKGKAGLASEMPVMDTWQASGSRITLQTGVSGHLYLKKEKRKKKIWFYVF